MILAAFPERRRQSKKVCFAVFVISFIKAIKKQLMNTKQYIKFTMFGHKKYL